VEGACNDASRGRRRPWRDEGLANDAWKGVRRAMNRAEGRTRDVVLHPKTTRELSYVRRERNTNKAITYLQCCEGVEGAFEGTIGGGVKEILLRLLKALLKVRLRAMC